MWRRFVLTFSVWSILWNYPQLYLKLDRADNNLEWFNLLMGMVLFQYYLFPRESGGH